MPYLAMMDKINAEKKAAYERGFKDGYNFVDPDYHGNLQHQLSYCQGYDAGQIVGNEDSAAGIYKPR